MGYLAAVLAFIVWGAGSTVLVRLVPLPGPAVSFGGCAIGALIMLAVVGPRRWGEVRTAFAAYPYRIMGLSAGFAGCSVTYQWAVKTTTIANAVLAHSLQPLITCMVFLPLLGQRRPSVREFLALMIGIIGLGIVLWPQLDVGGPMFGIVMGVASAVIFGWFNVQLPFFNDRLPRQIIQTCSMLVSAILLLPLALASGAEMPDIAGIGGVAAVGVCNFVVANMLFYYAIQRAPVGHVATLAYVEPVVGIGAAALWLNEPITVHAVIGGVLVLASGALIISMPKKR